MFTLSKGIGNESEVNEGEEENIEFLEARKDAAETLEPSEQTFNFVTLFIQGAVILPRLDMVGRRRDYRNPSQIQDQLAGLVVLVGSVHQHWQPFRKPAQASQQLAPTRRIVRLPWRER